MQRPERQSAHEKYFVFKILTLKFFNIKFCRPFFANPARDADSARYGRGGPYFMPQVTPKSAG
jgi:hypothetical protein